MHEGKKMKFEKNRKGILICFTGIDGSGKTTLAKSLANAMNEQAIESRYVWGGFESFMLLRPFAAIAKTLIFYKRKRDTYMENYDTKGLTFKNPFLSKLYHYLVLFDYIFQIFFKIKVPLMLGKKIVCDRYIYDIVVSMGVILDYSDNEIEKLLKKCLHIVPKPYLVFLIDLPEEIAYQRNLPKHDISSVTYISERRKIYLNISEEYEMTLLDGTKKPRDLESEVFSKVKEEVG